MGNNQFAPDMSLAIKSGRYVNSFDERGNNNPLVTYYNSSALP